MKYFKLFLSVLLLLLSFPAISKKYVHGYIHYPPNLIHDDSKKGNDAAKGWSNEISKEVYKRLNYDVEFKLLPWPRMIAGLKDGTVNFGNYANGNNISDPEIYADDTLYPISIDMYVISHKGAPIPKSIEDFNGKIVVSKRGWIVGSYQALLKMDTVKVHQPNQIQSGIQMFSFKRGDYLMIPSEALNAYRHFNKFQKFYDNIESGDYVASSLYLVKAWPVAISKKFDGAEQVYQDIQKVYQDLIKEKFVHPNGFLMSYHNELLQTMQSNLMQE